MKILYLSCHSVLEWDELTLLTELEGEIGPGSPVEVFSLGAFMNPTQSGDFKRTIIPKGKFYPHLYDVGMQCDKDRIHPELLEWADVVLSMHNSRLPGQKQEQPWIVNNWENFMKYNNKVVWRSIGQSTPEIEKELAQYKGKGLKIVRYSPIEKDIPHYAGEDAIIRFAKDPNEFTGWSGDRKQIITFAQSFKRRGAHLGYTIFEKIIDGFEAKVYGPDNEDLLLLNGGQRSYEELKRDMREARAYFYFGTVPAPYTLSLIEAMMTGVPVVAVGPKLRELSPYTWKNYEVPEIIANGVNGFWSDSIGELRDYITQLFEDDLLATRISIAARKTAVELFGKRQRQQEWSDFLRRLVA